MTKLTPKERKLDHKIRLEENRQAYELDQARNGWHSCCFEVDRRACVFITQTTILILVMAFCVVQLSIVDKCDSEPYLGIMTLCIGIIIPGPIFRKKDVDQAGV
jgi:hypothetical protein